MTNPKDFIFDTFNFNFFNDRSFYRPSGSLLHYICFKLFRLEFLPFHIVATILHLFNLAFLYILITKFVPSKFGRFLGTLFFSFHLTALPIYWYFFGTFDSFCAAFLLLCFLSYIKDSAKFSYWYFLSVLCFVIALRSKEMAFSFPLILIAYELLIARQTETERVSIKRILRKVWPFLVISLTAGLLKFSANIRLEKVHAYSLHFDVLSILEGLRFFVASAIYKPELPLSAALVLLIVLGIIPILLRSRVLAFGYLFILVSLLPILPLANRRADFHQYIPLIGVSIYVAELLYLLQSRVKAKQFLPQFYVLIVILLIAHSGRNWMLKKPVEDSYLKIAAENREFVEIIKDYKPGPRTFYLYDSAPKVLSLNSGVFAVLNLLFHDYYGMTVESTEDCSRNIPSPRKTDVACSSFKNHTIQTWPASDVP